MKPRHIVRAALLAGMLTLVCYPPTMPAQAGPARQPAAGRAAAAARRQAQQAARLQAAYGRLPLSFEPNQGQAPPAVRYLAHGAGYTLLLTAKGAVLALAGRGQRTTVRMRLAGVRQQPVFSGRQELAGRVNYLIGNDPARWHTQIPLYRQVQAANVYRGIALVYYGNRGRLEYDFDVHPGAHPGDIRLQMEGAAPARIAADGSLQFSTPAGMVSWLHPVAYQPAVAGHARRPVQARFVRLAHKQYGFRLGPYDHARPLVIDPSIVYYPALVYSTLLGSPSGTEQSDTQTHIAVDGNGDAYLVGQTSASDFPMTTGAYNPSFPGGVCTDSSGGSKPCSAIFITKLNASGSQLVYSTYLGGTNRDKTFGVALDSTGQAYVVGMTSSADFPVTAGAYQSQLASGTCDVNGGTAGACPNAFLTVLNASGSGLVYSTYLGGPGPSTPAGLSGANAGLGIAVLSPSAVFINGVSASSGFPTTAGVYQPAYPGIPGCYFGGTQGNCPVDFVARFDPTQSGLASLVYSTYLGGAQGSTGIDELLINNGGPAGGIAVDSAGNAYVTGPTDDYTFPDISGSFGTGGSGPIGSCSILGQSGMCNVAFVTKLNPTGTALVYSGFIGNGNGTDTGSLAIALDGSDDAYITGYTTSGFPTTAGAFQTSFGGGSLDAFVTEINAAGNGLVYSTYLGGSGDELEMANGGSLGTLAVDGSGQAYITGNTDSSDFPTQHSLQAFNQGNNCTATNNDGTTRPCTDAFITMLNANGSGLVFSSFFGSGGDDTGDGIALDASGNIYVSGETQGSGSGNSYAFPTTSGAFQTTLPCCENASFAAKISLSTSAVVVSPTSLNFGDVNLNTTSPAQTLTFANDTNVAVTPQSGNISGTDASEFNVLGASTCAIGTPIPAGGTCTLMITFSPAYSGSASAMLTVSTDSTVTPALSVPLSGNGVSGGTVSFSPGSLNFGNQAVGTTSAPQMVTITNTGTGPVNNINISTTSSEDIQGFLFAANCPSSLAAGASCTVNISFDPDAVATVNGQLLVYDDAAGSPQFINLSGSGVQGVNPGVTFSPASLSFGNQVAGTVSAPQTVTITNTGTSPLAITNIGTPSTFPNIQNCPSSLASMASCTVSVSFAPNAVGSTSGTLQVFDNAAGSPQFISLYGSGVQGTGVGNPVPLIAQPLVPDAAMPGAANFTLTVNGTGFVSGAAVDWNGQALMTTFVSSSQLTAAVSSMDVANGGTAVIAVVNPSGARSNPALFTIVAPSTNPTFVNASNSPFPAGNSPVKVAIGDFNGDGRMDLAIANNSDNTVTILLGNGNGTFTQAPGSPIAVGNAPYAIAVGDFNGDGRQDLAIANGGINQNGSNNVTILLGNGDGTFNQASGSPIAVGNGADALAVGDFNGDGTLDLAVANYNDATIIILMGNGDGTFTPASGSPLSVGSEPIAIAVGDFNHDGKLDLVVSDFGSSNVIVLLGNGDGTFTSAPSQPGVGVGPDGIAVGDFNGDGNLDLAVANSSSNNLTILLGNGSGGFTPASGSPIGMTNPARIIAGDFNGDGKLDLAVTNTTNNTVTLLLGNGDGTFTPAASSPVSVGSNPFGIAAGDFNNDGLLDFVTANLSNVSVMLQSPAGGSGFSAGMASFACLGASSCLQLNFGNQAINTTSAAQTLTITNTGTGPLGNLYITTHSNESIQGFPFTTNCSNTLAVGASCTVNISFQPNVIGAVSGQLLVSDDAVNSPQVLPLSGTGVQSGSGGVVTITPGNLGFGGQILGTTSSAQTVTITNTGSGTLGSIAISISPGSAASVFPFTTTCASTLAAGASCTVSLSFAPAVQGLATGQLQVADDAANSPQSIPIAGSGMLANQLQQIITTIAGGDAPQDLPANQAPVGTPCGLSADAAGNFYLGDWSNKHIYKINSAGQLTTIAGNGTVIYTGDGPATATGFELGGFPICGFTADSSGNVYFVDHPITGLSASGFQQTSTIREIVAATGQIQTLIPNLQPGYSGDGGKASNAQLSSAVFSLALDPTAAYGFIADSGNNVIREVNISTGIITTLAGNGMPGVTGDGGPAGGASLDFPTSIALDAAGNLYIAEANFVKEVPCATGAAGCAPPNGEQAGYIYNRVTLPTSVQLNNGTSMLAIAVDNSGNVYIADTAHNLIYSSPAGQTTASLYAGGGTAGLDEGGPATSATLLHPNALLAAGGNLYLNDPGNARVQLVNSTGNIQTIFGNGLSSLFGANLPATQTEASNYQATAADAHGNIYLSDTNDNVIREITPQGIISTVAGNLTSGNSGDNGPATSAQLNHPMGIGFDGQGNLYIADTANNVVREVKAATGIITTIAGNGTSGYTGDGGPATSAELNNPAILALDPAGDLFILDYSNVVREVTPDGIIHTVAGNGVYGNTGLGSPATSAELSPEFIAVDHAGNLFITDDQSQVLEVPCVTALSSCTPPSGETAGYLYAVAGNGTPGYSGDGGPATAAQLAVPYDLRVDALGNIFVLDAAESAIREFTVGGTITTIAGTGMPGFGGDGGPAIDAHLNWPMFMALTPAGSLVFDDEGNSRIRSISNVEVAGASVNPAALNFADQQVGTTSAPQTVTITNTGGANLVFSSISVNDNDFTVGNNTCATGGDGLVPGASCTVSVIFQPTVMGSYTVTLTLTDNAADSPQAVALSGTAFAPVASLSSASLSFGDQLLHTASSAQIVTLSNSGTAALAISSITAAGDFAETNTCGSTLAVGANCAISVIFTPTVTGARTGTLTLTDNAADSPQAVALSGTGIAPVASLSSASLDFGDQLLHTASSAQIVTLSNPGTAALAISSITAAGDFAETNTCGSTLAVGANCAISVIFTPTVTGARTGTLTITDSAGGSPQAVALSGTGTEPLLNIAPASLSFGNQLLHTASSAQIVTLSNPGTAALAISSIAASGDFAETNTCGSTLAVGANCAISVIFTPTATGARTGTLTITDNAGGSPQTVALSGTGTEPLLNIAPALLSFSNQLLNTTSGAQAVTLSNTGTAAMTISLIAASGDFAENNNCGASLAINATCAISVTFKPSAEGARTGTLTITDNAGGSPQTVALSGIGIEPMAVLSASTLDFGSQYIGLNGTPQTVTLSNTGSGATAPLSISGISASAGFVESSNCGSSLAIGASCTISVSFVPTTAGAYTGALTISDNAGNSPQAVALSGTGVIGYPTVTLNTTSLTFPSQQPGTISAAQPVIVSNTGHAVLNIGGIAIDAGFQQTNNCGSSLGVGSSCTIQVSFAPVAKSVGTITGNLTITDNAANSPQSVSLSGTAVTLNNWTGLTASGSLPWRNGADVLPDGQDDLIVFGGGNSQTNLNDTWVLSHADGLGGTPTWTELTPASEPPARHNAFAAYAAASNRLIVFGGCEGGCYPMDTAVWVLSHANGQGGTPAWSQLATSGTAPWIRQGGVTAYDPGSNRLIIFGGQNGWGSGGVYTDTWVLTNADGTGSGSPTWIKLATSGGPPQYNYFPGSYYDAKNNRLVVLGGSDATSGSSNAIWTLANANGLGGTPTWTNSLAQGTAGAPSNFQGGGMYFADYNAGSNLGWVLLVPTMAQIPNPELWQVSNANGTSTPAWNQTPASGLPNDGSGVYHYMEGMVFNPDSGVLTALLANSADNTMQAYVLNPQQASAPVVKLSASSLSYPSQTVASASAGQPITLTNIGTAPLAISSIAASGDFAASNDCSASLAINTSCTISVAFTPTLAGTRTGTLTIIDDAGDSPQTVALSGEGVDTTPAVSLSPTTWDFGNVYLGQAGLGVITLTNTGNATLAISGISVPAAFNLNTSSNCGSSLNAGASCIISVSFIPTTAGPVTGSLTISDNASGSPQSVALAGTGVVGAPTAGITPANGLSFGSQATGTPSTQTVILANTGNGAMTISSISASGDFSQVNGCGAMLAANVTCSISITFTPTATGSRSGTLSISDNAPNSPQTVTLSGTGMAPGISFTPSAIVFGGTELNATATAGLTIQNTGNEDLHISGASASLGDFAVASGCAIVPAGSSCSLNVSFTPTATGLRSGTISFTDDAAGSPQTVPVSGMGTAPGVFLAPANVSFPPTNKGASSYPITVTLTNSGTGALNNLAIAALGDYTITNHCPASLGAGQNCAIDVVFTPQIAGQDSGTLNFSDAAGQQTVNLSGTGLAPGASLSTNQLFFGGQLTGTTSPAQTVVLTNNGTGVLNITGITTLAGFKLVTSCVDTSGTGTLAAGASCPLNIAFAPQSSGVDTGSVVIADSAGTQLVQVTGYGNVAGLTVTPSVVTFGAEMVNTISESQTITVTNTGTTDLVLNPIQASGDFQAVSTCPAAPAVLKAGASCPVNVSFGPTTVGARSATLTVSDSAGTVTTSAILQGTGTLPGISTSPSTLFFGGEAVNTTSSMQTITVSNTGTAPLQIWLIKTSGDFSEINNCTMASLPAGQTCVISVAMTPTTLGSENGQIEIYDNADGLHTIALSGVGMGAGILLQPSSLAFGSQPIPSANGSGVTLTGPTQAVLLTNTGNAPLALSGLSIQSPFSQSNDCGTSLAPGASCTLSISFNPTIQGQATGSLTIADTSGNSESVALNGYGSPNGLTLSPSSLNFGTQAVNQNGSAQTVTLTNNTGQNISNLKIVASGEFSVTDTCGGAIANAGSCTLQVSLQPLTSGTITGSISISGNLSGSSSAALRSPRPRYSSGSVNANGLAEIALIGNGSAAGVSLSANNLTFVNQPTGTTSAAQTIVLTNSGQGDLAGVNIGISGDFSQSNTCTATVAAGAKCSIQVKFTPSVTGTRTGQLSITDSAAGSPQIVSLSGVGFIPTPKADLSAANLAFTRQPVGTASSPQVLTISNSGTANLTFSAIGLSGKNAADFAIATGATTCTTSAALVAGAKCTIGIIFTPGATGARSATLSLADNALTSPQTVALAGGGEDYSLAVTSGMPSSITISPGASANYSLSVAPLGNSTQSVTLACSGAPAYSTCSVSPASLTLDGTHTAAVAVTVTTTSGSFLPPPAPPSVPRLPPAIWLALAGWLAAGMLWLRRRRSRRWAWGGLAGLLLASAMLAGCGGYSRTNATPAGNYTLQVTATSGTQSHTTSLNLTVSLCPGCNSH